MPAQHPELCTTWSAAWYRLGALQGAIRKQILTQRELHHQAASETAMAGAMVGKAGKGNLGVKDKAVATAKQQQQVVTVVHQERYPSRRGGSAALALPGTSTGWVNFMSLADKRQSLYVSEMPWMIVKE